MAKNKHAYSRRMPPREKISRTEQEHFYITAKKILRQFELEPKLIDVFTKKQKEYLFKMFCDPPLIKAKEEKTVPRQYVRNINADTHEYMRTNYWGNPENKITYMELATYGLSFLGNLHGYWKRNSFLAGTPQEEAARKIIEYWEKNAFLTKSPQDKAVKKIIKNFDNESTLETTLYINVLVNMWYLTRCYSRINYRMYGFEADIHVIVTKRYGVDWHTKRFRILLTAQDSEYKVFIHNNIARKAFRMYITPNGTNQPKPATVSSRKFYLKSKSFSLRALTDMKLNIYIQSHVLQRFKQRMDVFEPYTHNLLLQFAFTAGIHLVSFDNQVLFSCLIEDGRLTAGYFTCFQKGGDIVINTFLPITSHNTPEGKKLYELLSLSKEEITYLGMDRISFFVKVDFEQIPRLKQALIDSTIWQLKIKLEHILAQDEEPGYIESLIDLNKTMFVKNFLDKREQQNAGML